MSQGSHAKTYQSSDSVLTTPLSSALSPLVPRGERVKKRVSLAAICPSSLRGIKCLALFLLYPSENGGRGHGWGRPGRKKGFGGGLFVGLGLNAGRRSPWGFRACTSSSVGITTAE